MASNVMIGAAPYFTQPLPRALTLGVVIVWVLAESLSGRANVRATDSLQDGGTRGWLFLTLAATFICADLAANLLPGAQLPGPAEIPLFAGAIVALDGIAFRAWAILTLGRFFTREVMIRDGHVVISNGPYRVVRHPAYSGTMLAMTGLGLMLGNWVSLLIVIAGFAVSHLPRIRHEERVLETSLGEPYRAFERTRKRLIPLVW